MTYKKVGPFTNGSTSPPISATFLNGVETELVNLGTAATPTIFAPAPSGDTTGATDQAALQPLLTTAATTGGTVYLRPGTYYVTGLATPQAFNQPTIQGPGRDYCTIQGTSGATKPAVKFKGGSGQAGGGGINDVTLANPAGTALQFADCNGLNGYRLKFMSAAIGVQFYNEAAGGFSEFNVVYDSDFRAECATAVRYSNPGGAESFHGSGIDGNCTINNIASGTTPMIVIDSGCLPYQSPLTFNGFPRANQPVIQNLNNGGNRAPQFYGTIRLECSTTANIAIGGGYQINFDGNVQGFGSTGLNLGTVLRTAASYYNNNGAYIRREPWAVATPNISSSPTLLAALQPAIGQLVEVTFNGPNYYARFLVWASVSPFDGSGAVSQLTSHVIANAAGYGGITWTVSNNNLYAAGSGFPSTASSQIGAYLKITPTGETNQIL